MASSIGEYGSIVADELAQEGPRLSVPSTGALPGLLFSHARNTLHWGFALYQLWAYGLAFALLLSSANAAELTLASPLTVDEITHSTARVCWATTGAVSASKQLSFDTTAQFVANNALAFKTVGYSTPFGNGSMCMALSGLTANTAYTVCPAITSGANATVCTSAGNSNSRAAFTTLTLPSTHPALPTAPSTFDTSYPTSFAHTFTVALDCSDRDTILSSASGQAYSSTYNNQNVKVVYPSLATQTSANCNLPMNLFGITKSGTGWVVITSSAEGSGPAEGVRTSPSNKTNSWMLCNSPGTTAVFYPTAQTRLVDLYLEPCDSAASSGDGDPRILKYLVNFDFAGAANIIFDRVNFDGRGYPYRLQNTLIGYGNNIAVVDSYINHSEIWQPWVNTTSISTSTNQIISASTFLMGTGLTTCTVPTFTITQSSTTGTAYLYVKTSDCSVHYVHSNGTATCSGCAETTGSSIASDGISLIWDGSSRAISYTSGTFGAQTFFSHANLRDLLDSSGVVAENEWDSMGIASNSCSSSSPTAKQWTVNNTYIGVTGFGVFPQGDCSPNGATSVIDTSDWTITNNTFQSSSSCLVAFGTVSGSSSPFVCQRRHHIEMKNGYRFKIYNNTMKDGFVGVAGNAAHAIDLKMDFIGSGATTVSAVNNIYIGHNTITNEAACFYIAGDLNNAVTLNYWKLISIVEIEQNICQSNAYAQSQFYLGTTQDSIGFGGIAIEFEEELEDIVIQHNTFYQNQGAYGSVLYMTDRWSEGVSFLNNIVYVNGPFTAVRGIQALNVGGAGWNVNSTPSFNTASGSDGSTAIINAILPAATADFRGNLFIAACALAANGQCVDATTSGSLVGDLSAQYPASNVWITSGTYGARQDAVGWTDRTTVPGGLFLSSSSSYHNAGTDGCDIGVYASCGSTPTGHRKSAASRSKGASRSQ